MLLEYQKILEQEKISAQDIPEHDELVLSGLVVKENEMLKVSNRIYAAIFNIHWSERVIQHLSII